MVVPMAAAMGVRVSAGLDRNGRRESSSRETPRLVGRRQRRDHGRRISIFGPDFGSSRFDFLCDTDMLFLDFFFNKVSPFLIHQDNQ